LGCYGPRECPAGPRTQRFPPPLPPPPTQRPPAAAAVHAAHAGGGYVHAAPTGGRATATQSPPTPSSTDHAQAPTGPDAAVRPTTPTTRPGNARYGSSTPDPTPARWLPPQAATATAPPTAATTGHRPAATTPADPPGTSAADPPPQRPRNRRAAAGGLGFPHTAPVGLPHDLLGQVTQVLDLHAGLGLTQPLPLPGSEHAAQPPHETVVLHRLLHVHRPLIRRRGHGQRVPPPGDDLDHIAVLHRVGLHRGQRFRIRFGGLLRLRSRHLLRGDLPGRHCAGLQSRAGRIRECAGGWPARTTASTRSRTRTPGRS